MAMLEAAGIAFESLPANVDEEALKRDLSGASPSDMAAALALKKALNVSRVKPDALVLGCDSVVSVNGRMFDKPRSRTEAEAHLRAFSGQNMVLVSAAALVRAGVVESEIVDEARLVVRPLSDAFVAAYLDLEWPAISGCVGCFRIEGRGVHLFETVAGDHFTILGMPLLKIMSALRGLSHGFVS